MLLVEYGLQVTDTQDKLPELHVHRNKEVLHVCAMSNTSYTSVVALQTHHLSQNGHNVVSAFKASVVNWECPKRL